MVILPEPTATRCEHGGQLAGAQAVVATLWRIPDDESTLLMDAFFVKLAASHDKAEALQYAQRLLIQQYRALSWAHRK